MSFICVFVFRIKFVMEVMQAFFYYRHTEKTSSCASNGTNCVMCISYDLWKCYLYCYKKTVYFFLLWHIGASNGTICVFCIIL